MTERQKIDLIKISFPSDSLTIGMLRKLYPLQFDADSVPDLDEGHGKFGSLFRNILFVERELAEVAFDATSQGNTFKPASYLGNLAELRQDLKDNYIICGLASGEFHAEQLVRSFESQAIELASRGLGRRP